MKPFRHHTARFAVYQHLLVNASDFIPFFPIRPHPIRCMRGDVDIDSHRPPRGIKDQKQQQWVTVTRIATLNWNNEFSDVRSYGVPSSGTGWATPISISSVPAEIAVRRRQLRRYCGRNHTTQVPQLERWSQVLEVLELLNNGGRADLVGAPARRAPAMAS
jgi:hypothetical protein